jgi:hypothetical protein
MSNGHSDPKETILESLREGLISEDDLPQHIKDQLGLGKGKLRRVAEQALHGPRDLFNALKVGTEQNLQDVGFLEALSNDVLSDDILGLDIDRGVKPTGEEQLEISRQVVRDFREGTEPQGPLETGVRVGSRVLTEGASFLVPGLGFAKGARALGAGTKLARGTGLLGEAAEAITIGQAGAEESAAGGLASLAGALGLESAQEKLEGVAEDRFQRSLAEAGLIIGGEAAIRGAGKALGRAKRVEAAEVVATAVEDKVLLPDGMGVLVREPKELTPTLRAEAAEAFGDTQSVFSPIKKKQGLGDWLRWQYIRWVDIDKPFEWASVRGMRPSEDPNILARNRRGSAAAAVRIWEDGLVRQGSGEAPRTLSPHKIIEDMAGGDSDALGWTMIAKREEELLGRGHDARLTPEELRTGLALYDGNPGLRSATDAFIDYGRQWLRLLEEEGVISAGAAERILEAGNYWFVPLKRVDTSLVKLPKELSAVFDDPLRVLTKGGDSAVYQNPAVAWLDLTFGFTDLVGRRRAINALAKIGDEGLNPTVVSKVDALPRSADAITKVEEGFSALGNKTAAEISKGMDLFQSGEKHFFKLFDNVYQVDDFLFEAIRDVNHAEIPAALRILTGPGKLLRTGVTVTPGFGGSNQFRDSIMRTMTIEDLNIYQSLYGSIGSALDLSKEALARMGAPIKESQLLDTFELSGAAMSTLADMDANRFMKLLDDMRQATPSYARNLHALRSTARDALHNTRMVGSIAENSNRLDTFTLIRQRTLDQIDAGELPGWNEMDANLLAAYQAAESTVDFRRRGRLFEENAWIKAIDQGTAFWRAAIQGNDRVMRLAVDIERQGVKVNKKRLAAVAATAATTLTLPAFSNYAANRMNPDYFDIPKNVRGRYLLFDLGAEGLENIAKEYIGAPDDFELPVFKQGGSLFLKAPVPHELGWLFATVPVRMLEEVDSRNPFREINVPNLIGAADPISSAFKQMGIPIPTSISVAEQLASNKDRFRGTSIEPQFAEGRPAPLRARGTESPGAMKFSEALTSLGVPAPSPPQAEFAVRGVLGGAGSAALIDLPGMLSPERSTTKLTEKGPLRRFFVDPRGSGEAGHVFYKEYFDLKGRMDASNRLSAAGKHKLAGKALPSPEDIARFNVMDFLYEDHLRPLNELRKWIEDQDIDPEGVRILQDNIKKEADIILKGATYNEKFAKKVLEEEVDPERSEAIRSLIQVMEEEKKKRSKTRRAIQDPFSR